MMRPKKCKLTFIIVRVRSLDYSIRLFHSRCGVFFIGSCPCPMSSSAVEVRFWWSSLVKGLGDILLLLLQGIGSLIVVDFVTEAKRGDGNINPLAVPPSPFPGWVVCFTQAWVPLESWSLVVGSVVLNRGPCAERALGDRKGEAVKGESFEAGRGGTARGLLFLSPCLASVTKSITMRLPRPWRRSRMSSRPSTRLGHWNLTSTADDNTGQDSCR